jgi:hypothetical protein
MCYLYFYGDSFRICFFVVFVTIDLILIFGVVMPFSAIFQLYHGDQL